jgi:type IV pilus assembly protein PilB
MVSVSMAQMYRLVPVTMDGNTLTVALADPQNLNALDDLRFMLNCDVTGAVADEVDVDKMIEHLYGGQKESLQDLVQSMSPNDMQLLEHSSEDLDPRNIEAMANAAPVVKFLNLVLLHAIKDKASDVHFEPYENGFRIRYRIDGTLLEIPPPPVQLALPLISRIKVMSNLDIAERRVPQDGRIELTVAGRPIDLRVSTLPTYFGESVVMRVLDRSVVSLDLERLGMREEELAFFRDAVAQPNGIILVTGPTGSGKTTTLYSALNAVNTPDLKIITTEDPVEYDLDGIIQVPVSEEIGVTYSACLRSILRQDPDKILVGEIRDLETAEFAVEASLTGHLVFSTLHTNDAPSTVTRLLDMGVEPFLISATLHAVVAQRLVRTICVNCKSPYTPTEEELLEINLKLEDLGGRQFYYGRKCEHCNKLGYRGRCAILEIMKIDEKLRELIMERKSTDVIRAEAQAGGMRTLRESGILKIFDGITTVEEVVSETLSFI